MGALTDAVRSRVGFNPIRWLQDARRMRARLREFGPTAASVGGAPVIAVIVMPWLDTAVPWFSISVGVFLAHNGCRVRFVVDAARFGKHPLRSRFVLACIRWVLKGARSGLATDEVPSTTAAPALDADAQKFNDRLTRLNVTWAMRGETSESGRHRAGARIASQLAAAYGAIGAYLRDARHDAVFLPGGIYGTSGTWAEHARNLGIRLTSFDSGGFDTLMIAANGIASQLHDIPLAFAMLKSRSLPEDERQLIEGCATAELDRRQGGRDRFSSQLEAGASEPWRYGRAVLIALNSSWDSAALGLHSVFDSGADWIVATVDYLLRHSDVTVIVRQHPVERFEYARTTDDYESLLRERFGDHPRVAFIAAGEPVNSYGLLRNVLAVVVHTSTIGIEATILNRVVVTASNGYYSELPFVWKARSLPQYHERLAAAANGAYAVTSEMRADALTCYYLTQCCNWIVTPFNVQNFAAWSAGRLADLHAREEVQFVLESLQSGVPVAYLSHLARLQRQRDGAA